MRQLTYTEPGHVEWLDVPEPDLDDDGALVRPLAVARCDLDAAMVAAGLFPGPFAVGHEVVGEIVATGPAVVARHVGERVLVPFQVSCGRCRQCVDHRFAACGPHRARAGAAFGFGPAGGGHGGAVADLLMVPHADHMLVPAPHGVPAVVLCTIPDNVVDGYRTVAGPLAACPGADVSIIGGAGGSIGLYAAAAALALGASGVRYHDDDPERCSAAEALGARAELIDGPLPRRFERAMVTVAYNPSIEGLNAAIRSTDDFGYLTVAAIHFAPAVEVPMLEMYTRGITLHTSRADSRRFLPEVLDLVASGRLDPNVVPTTVVPWEAAADEWTRPHHKLVLER
jgi:threonine dehydrogenase-like Zn-dependent dehydrogenase